MCNQPCLAGSFQQEAETRAPFSCHVAYVCVRMRNASSANKSHRSPGRAPPAPPPDLSLRASPGSQRYILLHQCRCDHRRRGRTSPARWGAIGRSGGTGVHVSVKFNLHRKQHAFAPSCSKRFQAVYNTHFRTFGWILPMSETKWTSCAKWEAHDMHSRLLQSGAVLAINHIAAFKHFISIFMQLPPTRG